MAKSQPTNIPQVHFVGKMRAEANFTSSPNAKHSVTSSPAPGQPVAPQCQLLEPQAAMSSSRNGQIQDLSQVLILGIAAQKEAPAEVGAFCSLNSSSTVVFKIPKTANETANE